MARTNGSAATQRTARMRAETMPTIGANALKPSYKPVDEAAPARRPAVRPVEAPKPQAQPQRKTRYQFAVRQKTVPFSRVMVRFAYVACFFAVALLLVSRNATITRLNSENQSMLNQIESCREQIAVSSVYSAVAMDLQQVLNQAEDAGMQNPQQSQLRQVMPTDDLWINNQPQQMQTDDAATDDRLSNLLWRIFG